MCRTAPTTRNCTSTAAQLRGSATNKTATSCARAGRRRKRAARCRAKAPGPAPTGGGGDCLRTVGARPSRRYAHPAAQRALPTPSHIRCKAPPPCPAPLVHAPEARCASARCGAGARPGAAPATSNPTPTLHHDPNAVLRQYGSTAVPGVGRVPAPTRLVAVRCGVQRRQQPAPACRQGASAACQRRDPPRPPGPARCSPARPPPRQSWPCTRAGLQGAAGAGGEGVGRAGLVTVMVAVVMVVYGWVGGWVGPEGSASRCVEAA